MSVPVLYVALGGNLRWWSLSLPEVKPFVVVEHFVLFVCLHLEQTKLIIGSSEREYMMSGDVGGSDCDWWVLRLPSIAGVPINCRSSHQFQEFPSIAGVPINSKSSHQFLEFPSISGVPINSGHISWCMDHVIHSMWCPENFQQQSLLFTKGLLEEGLASWKHL